MYIYIYTCNQPLPVLYAVTLHTPSTLYEAHSCKVPNCWLAELLSVHLTTSKTWGLEQLRRFLNYWTFIQVQVSLCFPARRHEGVLGEWRWVVSFTPRESDPATRCIGGWVGPRAGLDAGMNRKIPSPDHPARSPALYHWTIPAPTFIRKHLKESMCARKSDIYARYEETVTIHSNVTGVGNRHHTYITLLYWMIPEGIHTFERMRLFSFVTPISLSTLHTQRFSLSQSSHKVSYNTQQTCLIFCKHDFRL